MKALCSQVGLKYVDLPDNIMGAGIGVGFKGTDCVVLSVMGGGGEGKLMITSGLLKDIKRDRLAALDACNTFTRNNSIFPVFLHDAGAGWSLLVQLTYTIDLMLGNPDYFSMIVRTTPRSSPSIASSLPRSMTWAANPGSGPQTTSACSS